MTPVNDQLSNLTGDYEKYDEPYNKFCYGRSVEAYKVIRQFIPKVPKIISEGAMFCYLDLGEHLDKHIWESIK